MDRDKKKKSWRSSTGGSRILNWRFWPVIPGMSVAKITTLRNESEKIRNGIQGLLKIPCLRLHPRITR